MNLGGEEVEIWSELYKKLYLACKLHVEGEKPDFLYTSHLVNSVLKKQRQKLFNIYLIVFFLKESLL